MNGARVLVKSLEAQGVEYIFGIPGGVLLAVHDALYDSKKIKHVLFRHEQVAAHAADGYARATGRVGVCMATSGPGATNLVTGIANAYMDSVPIVAVTGQVAKTVIGTDAFQEADITGITLPIVKHSYLVSDPADIPRLTKEAFHIASTGRPGPVLIDMPRDISQTEVDYKADQEMALAGYKPTYKGHAKQIKAAAAAIAKSKKPLLYVGGGVITSGGAKELLDLAEHAGIFVTTTLLGKGAFPETHRLSLGMLGMHGTKYANYAISNCDLIIAVGARFDDRVTGKLETFAPGAEVIHIDIDPAEISKNVPAMVPVVGDAKAVLKAILQTLRKAGDQADRTAWDGQVKRWRRDHPLTYEKSGSLKPEQI
ncbi:MAG: biosynthetic-type acetolactate synthase large subunit, partial [Terriglobia bacterium]